MIEEPNESSSTPSQDAAAEATDPRQDVWSTGDTQVDEAVAQLAELDDRDLAEHADRFDAIQRDLADVLDDARSAPASGLADNA